MPPTPPPMPPAPAPMPAPMSSGMSVTAKVILVVVILAILGGGYYWYASQSTMTPVGGSATTQTPSGAGSPDTSNAALVQDSAAIDTQMSGLNSDNTSMNSSDQPVMQSY